MVQAPPGVIRRGPGGDRAWGGDQAPPEANRAPAVAAGAKAWTARLVHGLQRVKGRSISPTAASSIARGVVSHARGRPHALCHPTTPGVASYGSPQLMRLSPWPSSGGSSRCYRSAMSAAVLVTHRATATAQRDWTGVGRFGRAQRLLRCHLGPRLPNPSVVRRLVAIGAERSARAECRGRLATEWHV